MAQLKQKDYFERCPHLQSWAVRIATTLAGLLIAALAARAAIPERPASDLQSIQYLPLKDQSRVPRTVAGTIIYFEWESQP